MLSEKKWEVQSVILRVFRKFIARKWHVSRPLGIGQYVKFEL